MTVLLPAAEYIPKLHPRSFSFSGLNFSDKSSTYLLVLVVRSSLLSLIVCVRTELTTDGQMLGRNLRTLLPFVPGTVLGLLFSATPLAKLRLPSFLCALLGVRAVVHRRRWRHWDASAHRCCCSQVLHPLFDVVPASAIALQRQRRVLEAQRRLGLRPNAANGQGFRDQLLPGAGGGLLPPQMAAAPPSEDAIQQLTVRPRRALALLSGRLVTRDS